MTVIVLALLNTLFRGPPNTYNIILDNLFTSIKLLVFFSQKGYDTYGTIRITADIY